MGEADKRSTLGWWEGEVEREAYGRSYLGIIVEDWAIPDFDIILFPLEITRSKDVVELAIARSKDVPLSITREEIKTLSITRSKDFELEG